MQMEMGLKAINSVTVTCRTVTSPLGVEENFSPLDFAQMPVCADCRRREGCMFFRAGGCFVHLKAVHGKCKVAPRRPHGAAQKSTFARIGPQGNHRRTGYFVTDVLGAQSKKAWTDITAPVALSGYRDHRPVRAMIPTKAVIAKTTPTQRPPRWNSDALLEARWVERHAEVRWGVALALKRYLDVRGGRLTDPAGAYNYLEHHMVKKALPHFSLTRERARKNQTPISHHNFGAGEKEAGHSKGFGDGPWDQEVPGKMPSVCGSLRDAETGQERSAMRETSHSRGVRGTSGERRHV